jgi:hypothetical protein
MPHLRQTVRRRLLPSLALAAFAAAPIVVTLSASAQDYYETSKPEMLDVYGPYAAKFLLGGRGIQFPLVPSETLLQGTAPWTMSLWFRPAAASKAPLTTLLAGFGDPAGEDSRYLGLKDGKPLLRMGEGIEVVATTAIAGDGWHHISATFDGATAHLYLDGAEVASGTPVMGDVEEPEILIGPDFISDQEARYRWDQPHLPPTVPPRLRVWNHFGGAIAGFGISHVADTADQVRASAADKPQFDLIPYYDGSKPWPFQVRQEVGYTEPQPPNTLPHDKAPFGKAVAKPLPPAGPTLEQTQPDQWTLARNWMMQAAPKVSATAEQLAAPGADTTGWYAATMPGTVLTTYVDRGVYPNPEWDLNNLDIPEYLCRQNYWYRVEFPTPDGKGLGKEKRYTLDFNGINYVAHVWLNGKELGNIKGAFIRGIYDVTDALKTSGRNVLAVEIEPAPHPGIPEEESIKAGPGFNGGAMVLDGPTFMDTEGWDWIPAIRDRDTGIWQDVTLHETGVVKLGDPQIITTLPLPRRDSADVLIKVPVNNTGTAPEKVTLHAAFEGGVDVTDTETVPPGESTLALTPEKFHALHVENPRLWWPNGYGKPELYHLELTLDQDGTRDDASTTQFGIREVTYEASLFADDGTLRRVEVNPTMASAMHQVVMDVSHNGMRQLPDGWASSLTRAADDSPAVKPVTNEPGMTDLVIKVNGVRIAARGGNWGMEDAMKRIGRAHLEPYFRLHQIANVNIIRNWQGQNTEPVFYDLADEYGMMVWNDFWESTEDSNAEAEDPTLFLQNAADVVERYRNHPSIVMWCGRNEGVPQPAINKPLAELLRTMDGTRYYSPSSNRVNLRNSGPYHYEDPKLYFDTLNRGFSVELGIPSLSTAESLRYWIAPSNLWPVSDAWAYHDWHVGGNGDVTPFMDHVATQFGTPTSFMDMEHKVQMFNYTLHRAIFEGFNAHLWAPNSGRMIWMTQPAWPSNMWQMFSHDYDTQASFYGVMHASEAQHVQLDLSNYNVAVINTTIDPIDGASVEAGVYSLDNKQLYTKTIPVSVAMDDMKDVFQLPLAAMFAQPEMDAPVFVRLKLTGSDGKVLSSNIYWLAGREQDMRKMDTLAQADVAAHVMTGPADERGEKTVTAKLTNQGTQAAVELKLTLEEAQGGARILPAYYSDNYVTLLPGESETVTIHYPKNAATGDAAVGLRGFNLKQSVLPIAP